MSKPKTDFEILRSFYAASTGRFYVTLADKRRHRVFFEVIELDFDTMPTIDQIRAAIKALDEKNRSAETKLEEAYKLIDKGFNLESQ